MISDMIYLQQLSFFLPVRQKPLSLIMPLTCVCTAVYIKKNKKKQLKISCSDEV